MNTISSSGTFYYKRIFPTFFFGVVLIVSLVVLIPGAAAKQPQILVILPVLAIFGYFIMQRFVWDLADEVLDMGDHLIVRKSGREIHVRIADIINVSVALMQNPPRITLRLASPSELGSDIAFMVKRDSAFNPFKASCSVADDLIRRVDAVRRNLADPKSAGVAHL